MTRERGSASIWVLACALLVLAFGYTLTLRGMAVLARHRADGAADLAALAAAGRIGLGGDPCSAAAQIASANHATLTACDTELAGSGRSGSVRVTVRVDAYFPIVGRVSTQSSARAGRMPVGDVPP